MQSVLHLLRGASCHGYMACIVRCRQSCDDMHSLALIMRLLSWFQQAHHATGARLQHSHTKAQRLHAELWKSLSASQNSLVSSPNTTTTMPWYTAQETTWLHTRYPSCAKRWPQTKSWSISLTELSLISYNFWRLTTPHVLLHASGCRCPHFESFDATSLSGKPPNSPAVT
jgi:hypothetical protein